ncbi:MAG: hypothetical protein EBR30_26410 [Cytophagia bacterium]|nr:hypothetical protein [Cytophagia bacterium]
MGKIQVFPLYAKELIEMKLKDQLVGIFQKFGIDPNAHGVKFETEVTENFRASKFTRCKER